MFKNYLKTALRFLKKNKLFTFINLLGLSIALAISFVIVLYVVNELSYNSCYKNKKSIYNVITYHTDSKDKWENTPFVLASTLKEDFPEITAATNLRSERQIFAKVGEERIRLRAKCTNDDFFKIFDIPFKYGSADHELLTNPDAIVLSESLAQKIYGDENPVGKDFMTSMYNTDKVFTVTGVYKDLPKNSSIQAECLVNERWAINELNYTFHTGNSRTNWYRDFWTTWILVDSKSKKDAIVSQLPTFEEKHLDNRMALTRDFQLHSFNDFYLHSSDIANIAQGGRTGNAKNVRLFSIIAILVVLVAIVNYIILSTAVSTLRAKEIGIRKTNGASNSLLQKQFFGESLMIAILSVPFALFLAWLAIPAAGKLFDTRLELMSSNVIIYILIYLGIALLVGIASGLYSAGHLSRIKVIEVFKKQQTSNHNTISLRSALVAFQLVIFCTFVTSAMVVRSQYRYSLNRDMGFDAQNVLLVDIPSRNQYVPLLDKIRNCPYVIHAGATTDAIPTGNFTTQMANCENNPNELLKMEYFGVDYQFLEAMGITPIEGRLFSEDYSNDDNCVVINETAVKQLGIVDPIGKIIRSRGKTIIGVVKDFNLHSIQNTIPPLNIELTKKYMSQIAISYQPGTRVQVIQQVESIFKELYEDRTPSYYEVADIYAHMYAAERNLSNIISLAALFTAIISALGLLGLTLFDARSRTKEIGIKKAMGSSSLDIIFALGKKNTILVLVANVISIPISYIVINRWLENYAYKTPIYSWIFIITGIVTLIITTLTISWQSWKAANKNPVEALRYE